MVMRFQQRSIVNGSAACGLFSDMVIHKVCNINGSNVASGSGDGDIALKTALGYPEKTHKAVLL
jgi:hypothetical protein